MLKYCRKIVTVLQGGFKMKRLSMFFLIVLCWHQARGDILNVPSFENPTIQSAINDANNGDTVIVSPGSYRENINFLGKAITLTSQDPNNPNIVAATIIDGNQPPDPNKGSVVTFSSGEKNNSVLSGFTITGGTGSWLLVSWQYQGLLWNRCGGGAVCYNMSEPTISKNVFVNNIAGQGGGIYVYGNPVNPGNPSNPNVHVRPIITDNTFTDNYATTEHGFVPPDSNYPNGDHGDGGAIVGFQGCDAVLTGNTIQNNYAYCYGGGIHLRQWSNGLIQKNHILNNGSLIGGGIHITYSSSPDIIENLIENNQSGSGAAIYVYFLSQPFIARNQIKNNSSTNGIIGVHYSSAGKIINNLIADNTIGATIITTESTPQINHNTIIRNEYRGILCNGTPSPKIENNIIAQTRNGYGIACSIDADPVIRYNNVWNNKLGDYGKYLSNLEGIDGNISVNPDLIDSVHLNLTSPCINAGDPNFSSPGETDIDGNCRILLDRTDIGADEVLPLWNLTSKKQYATIQNAVDDSNNFDDIVAITRRYTENIKIHNKSITLRSIYNTNWDCITHTIIDGNQTNDAVITFEGAEDSNCLISGFTITGAANNGQGGAVKGNGTFATIDRCVITNNSAYSGAGIFNCDGLIKNCKIKLNASLSSGGGLADCDGKIHNCFIFDNYAENSGGGLFNCNADIINNTITRNRADIAAGGLQECIGKITNNVIWINYAPNQADLNDCNTPTFCCITEPSPGQGNIQVDPNFIDPNNDNFHLTIYSPCIDVGDNNAISPQFTTDFDNEPRIYTNEPNQTPKVEIGADEVITNPFDLNIDGIVDYYELRILTEEWLQSGSGLQSDFHKDNFIDFRDFAELANQWLWTGGWHQ
jgi:parallel beta-helix repeat protein